ncbi:MAG: DNA polymerase I [Alistipes sp.]|jgi:DNA polymerase-1|nr:DNA polymerase I [Alistipes sp.]
MEKLFLLDAYALIFRAYYAFLGRPMRNSAGVNTSAVFGFTKFLRDIIVRERPRHLGVAFDPRGGNFRHELYPLYKANRSATPEDIVASVPYIKRILEAMRIPAVEVAGWEADDVIGTLSVKAAAEGFTTFMVTPDKDYGQLVTDRSLIYKQRKSGDGVEIVDREAIRAQYGIDDPRLVIDILALWGDASDNVPGVPGIGEKGATKLVCQFGTVENILANVDSLTGRTRDNIVANREQLLLAKRLVTIDTAVPVDFEPAALEMADPDCPALREIYTELGFNMFLREMASDSRSPFNSAILCRGTAAAGARPEFNVADIKEPIDKATQATRNIAISAAQSFEPIGFDTRNEARRNSGQQSLFDEPATDELPTTESQPDLFSSAPTLDTLATTPHDYRTIADPDELRALVKEFEKHPEFAWDTETTGYDPFRDRMIGISMCAEPGRAFWIPLTPETQAERLAILRPLFENPNIAKIGQNLKFDEEFVATATAIKQVRPGSSISPEVIETFTVEGAKTSATTKTKIEIKGRRYDTMLLDYLLDPESRHGMNHLANKHLNYDPIPISTLIGSGARLITMDMVPPDRVAEYAAEDADVTLRLKHALWPKIQEQNLEKLYLDIEEPLIEVLGAMEREGVRIDTQILADYSKELSTRLEELEAQIREQTADPTLNVNSAKQLGEVLFAKMRLAGDKPRMTKTRQYSTDEETLQGLAGRHPVIGLVLEYRGVKKLLSTYVEALPELVNPVTGRIHTSYNQAVTATGRLSSTGPNLQNIPIREEQGRTIRRAFVASDSNHLLLSADYSQVELRLMAHLSKDPAMIEAFRAGEDIHRATAARIFGVSLAEVTSEQRRRAKTANFGIIYGISAFGLAQRLGIPRGEAADIIEGYFRSYPGVRDYMERVVAEARDNGYVETIFGRRRTLPDINSRNATARGLAERNAINAPIQGGAADIMKIAMIRIQRELRTQGLHSRMILQVHDEVVVDTLRSEQEAVAALVVASMEGAASLDVDLLVDYGTGDNWLDAH